MHRPEVEEILKSLICQAIDKLYYDGDCSYCAAAYEEEYINEIVELNMCNLRQKGIKFIKE